MKNFFYTNENGFTLVETMISMTIFIVVVTVGMGAVLNATSQHYMAQNIRSAMDGLSSGMEDISRNARLGTAFHCFPSGSDSVATTSAESCSVAGVTNTKKIALNSISGGTIVYQIVGTPARLQKISGSVTQDITNPDIEIDTVKSFFYVVGAEAGDGIQPIINIRLVGNVLYKGVPSNFSIETTATQRTIDS